MSNSILKKYKDMANTRGDFNNINMRNFMLPTMGEMIEEDLMNDLLKQFVDEDVNNDFVNQDHLDAAYYVEQPFSTTPGYHDVEAAFVLKTKNLANAAKEITWEYNHYDGDTTGFLIADIDDGDDSFTFNDGKSYRSFKDYYKKMGGSSTLTIRHAGIDAPEVPHFTVQAVPKDNEKFLIIDTTYKGMKELIDKGSKVYYLKYPVNDNKTEVIPRKNEDKVKLLKTKNNGKYVYYELLKKVDRKEIEGANENYDYYKILGKEDESELNTIIDGYKAQQCVKDMIASSSEILLVVDANQLSVERMSKGSKTFNSIYYMTDAIDYLLEEWKKSYRDIPSTNYSYSPYGMDAYTRSMGVVYVKTTLDGKPAWINLNKYVAANVKSTRTNPDYNSSPELQEMKSGMSEVFELWSYNQENIEWLDSFNSLTKKSYQKKINLHKQLTGIDFTEERDCALMIGDTFMLIPPESIRNITQVGYERIPNMRSKGTMAKQMGQNEHMLELTLYFYGEDGINGIPYKHTFPNGKQQTYYMNGLRSLIAQFKLTPYLPIENGYINDVLGIEAVSLMNMNIESVKGFPRLYRVILSLREFNYRTFMPDLPVEDEYGENNGKIAELNPMFAKSFDWDIFRYYYQRGIKAGQDLSEIQYGTYDWNLQFYTHKNTIGPWDPCGLGELNSSSVSFYIPDENWLEQALQLKKQRDANYMSNFSEVQLSANAEEFLETLALLDEAIDKVRNKEYKDFEKQVSQLFSLHNRDGKKIVLSTPFEMNGVLKKSAYIENITDSLQYSSIYLLDGKNKINKKSFQNTYVSHIYNAFRDAINNPRYMKGLVLNEKISRDENNAFLVTWEFNIRLNTDGITDDDMIAIREVLSKKAGVDMVDVFKDNIVKVNFNMIFTPCLIAGGEILDFTGKIATNGVLFAGSSNGTPEKDTNSFVYTDSADTKALKAIYSVYEKEDDEDEFGSIETSEPVNEQNGAIDFYIKDYKNPANMPFVPYIENVLAEQVGATMGNTFTDISLKAIEGVGPQYLGGQDIVLELNLITDDIVVVSALNNLPNMASSLSKRYKRILPAWPLKIRSALTDMLGVSEVLIDAIEVSTIEGLPGVYSIAMRLTSVDRTQRQREALRRLDVKPNGGKVDYHGNSNLAMRNFFEIEDTLSQAELYPDLDLPTIKELAQLGYRYVKYSGKARSYVDPDFYITYAYPYTSLIIKKLVNETLSKQLLNENGETDSLQKFTLRDTLGAEVTAKVEQYTGLEVDSVNNKEAKLYEETLNSLTSDIRKILKNNKNLSDKDVEKAEEIFEITSIMKYLTMCDVHDGWEIRPGWRAPLCLEPTNTAIRDLTKESFIEQNNSYAKDIKDIRQKALRLIDNILGKPLSYNGIMDNTPEFSPKIIADIVNNMFSSGDGKALMELLCPGVEIKKAEIDRGSLVIGTNDSLSFNEDYFAKPNPLNFLVGYTYAAGCALSGHEEYRAGTDLNKWAPNHHGFGSELYTTIYAEDQPNTYMPYCVENRIEGKPTLATRIDSAIKNGTCFGAYRITKYSSATVVSEIADRTDNSIMYGGYYFDETYKDKDNEIENSKKYVKPGFLDPYYNYLDEDDEKDAAILDDYKKKILLSKSANVEAFLRVMLVHLRKLILDGLIFSEIDIMATTYSEISTDILSQVTDVKVGYINDEIMLSDLGEALAELGFNREEMSKLLNSLKESSKRSFCARLAYPFLTAITKCSSDIYSSLKHRDYDSLNALTGYIQGGNQNSESRSTVIKFLSALAGIDLTLAKDGKNESHVSESQMLANNMMKDVYIQAADNPKAYILHSFYDMLVNDKRGRLVRAFPTYYVVFIDEGRKIGSWKLHDNFYNMNSISEIQVVKSRKIAADTCTITMNNMFNSYTMEPDITTTQQYTDIYGLRDVFNSIFSPQIYFEKEKRIRLRQTVPDKVVLQPGIRIHVRMGYSADGSKLPIVFNGKVAEVDVADVAQIVAQGDGHELMNPLNAFGEMEVTSLDPAQSAVTWFKDIRGSLSSGGETPRDLLAKLLTAKYGGWKKVANKWFDGRWFNDNPFGITHFGDPKFNNIFELGEPVQNLYEVADENLLKGTNELYTQATSSKVSPIINTSLQDKTLWDILHLCANTGLEYIGAIRDFGFRSTIFLGKPNHYYAYAYEMVDGKVVERRKPFQQFHYYDSYNDIIYNSIKASEAQMKTNAVGLWQSSAMLWGREQATVGPIYLDMNIYPEYQKSMTVDTGLLAAGNGGIDIPFVDHFAEEWNLNPNDDKVNKQTAWRVTANALKTSVKDMYQGDVAVIGDPSVKPHDRCYIYDTYEDMMGQFEVEAVIHTMSADTGFTTSIMPDVIARHDDKFEAATQSLLSTTTTMMSLMVAGNIAEKLWTINVNNKLAVSVAKSKGLYGATSKLNGLVKNISNAPGMNAYLEKHPNAKHLFESLSFNPQQTNLDVNRITGLIDELSEMTLQGGLEDNLRLFSNMFSKYQELDMDKYQNAIDDAIKNDKFGFTDKKKLEEKDKIFKEMLEEKKKLDKAINTSNINLKEFSDSIQKNTELMDKIKFDTDLNKIIKEWNSMTEIELDSRTLKQFSELLCDSNIQDAIKSKKLVVSGLDELFDSFKTLFKSGGSVFKNAASKLKGGALIDDILKAVKGLVKFNWATLLADIALNTFVFIITKNTQSVFTRWLQGIQAIDVYPLKKNGKALIAGMNGHKGSVYGYPPEDGYDSIQGMILQTLNGIKSLDGNFPIQWADGLVETFVDAGVLESLSRDWRENLGIESPTDEEANVKEKYSEDLKQELFDSISSQYATNANHAYAIMTRYRKQTFDTKNRTDETYKEYEINGISASNMATNEKVRRLYYINKDDDIWRAVIDKKLIVSHSKGYTNLVTIPFESGSEKVPVFYDKGIFDTPLLQEDALYVLKSIVNDKSIDGKIHFKSGARFNDVKYTWKTTGFAFTLEYKGSNKKFKEVLDRLMEDTKLGTQYLFKYKQSGDIFMISVYAPISSSQN